MVIFDAMYQTDVTNASHNRRINCHDMSQRIIIIFTEMSHTNTCLAKQVFFMIVK